MKILVFYVDKQYFNMVTLFLRLRVRRELIIRRDGRAVEGTGLENRRCESIRGFESHSLRQLNFSIDLRKYPRGRRGSPAKGVGRVKSAAEVQILSSAPRKTLKLLQFQGFFVFPAPKILSQKIGTKRKLLCCFGMFWNSFVVKNVVMDKAVPTLDTAF